MNKMTTVDAEAKVAKRAAPKRKLMRLAWWTFRSR